MKTAVITFSRNDGYKEKERIAIHLNSLLDSFDEVNYVDWNSPNDNSLLYEVLDMIPKTGRIKHFIIPNSIHQFFADQVPDFPNCFGPISINLALRRTDADWIAVTTTDNIPPTKNELSELIQSSDGKTFYTFSRREIEYSDALNNINDLNSFRDRLKHTTEPRYFNAKVTPNDTYSIINCCGDLQLATRKIWMDIKGYEENMFYMCYLDTNAQKKVILNGYTLQAVYDIPMYHMSHENLLPQAHTTTLHKNASKTPPIYNDPWEWVEYFTDSKNSPEWGLADVDIEFEMI